MAESKINFFCGEPGAAFGGAADCRGQVRPDFQAGDTKSPVTEADLATLDPNSDYGTFLPLEDVPAI